MVIPFIAELYKFTQLAVVRRPSLQATREFLSSRAVLLQSMKQTPDSSLRAYHAFLEHFLKSPDSVSKLGWPEQPRSSQTSLLGVELRGDLKFSENSGKADQRRTQQLLGIAGEESSEEAVVDDDASLPWCVLHLVTEYELVRAKQAARFVLSRPSNDGLPRGDVAVARLAFRLRFAVSYSILLSL
jgi:hypothetical protein